MLGNSWPRNTQSVGHTALRARVLKIVEASSSFMHSVSHVNPVILTPSTSHASKLDKRTKVMSPLDPYDTRPEVDEANVLTPLPV